MLFFIVLFITILSFAADALSQHIPFSVEHRLVRKVHIDTQSVTTGPAPQYLQHLADDLSKNMQLPEDMKITVSIVNSNVVNAFATLGGNVVFFTGLLEKLPNENTLAMVLAHEIAHIKLRHPLRALGRGVVVGLAIATVAGASANGVVDSLIGNTGLLTALSFTRDQESAADNLAVDALVKLYGHAGGSTELFAILSKEEDQASGLSKAKTPEFFATHPLGKNRIAAIINQAQKNHWPMTGNMQDIPRPVSAEIRRLHNSLQTSKPKKKTTKKPNI